MLSVDEARRKILEQCAVLPPRTVPLLDASTYALAEPIVSEGDSPPFDKALMDGYAVRHDDLETTPATLTVLEEIVAGQTPRLPLEPGQASRIMTGAPIPTGCDAVVPIEQTTPLPDGRVEIHRSVRAGDNVLPRGREMMRGEVILEPGKRLRPQEIGMLATVGRSTVAIVPPARVAILATGDELVEADSPVGPGQIRNSNAPMLAAQVSRAGGQPRILGIARDREDDLRSRIEEGLADADVLILSGGVSAGKLDLVPEVLRQQGVVAHFHKIALKPGKPLFFGTVERSEGKRLVFGLPGNPVSSYVCFALFVRTAIRVLSGQQSIDLPPVTAKLEIDFAHVSDRPTYYPAWVEHRETGWAVRPVAWFGSADLRAFVNANCLLALPEGSHRWKAGENVSALLLDQ